LRRTVLLCFFAVTTLLKPANMPKTTENDGNKLNMHIFECGVDLLCGLGRDMIGEFRSSETISSAHNWSLIHFGLNFANRAFFEV